MGIPTLNLLHLSNRKPHLVFEILQRQAEETKKDGSFRALVIADHFRRRGEMRDQCKSAVCGEV